MEPPWSQEGWRPGQPGRRRVPGGRRQREGTGFFRQCSQAL